jgi:hypothetical protein
MKLQSLALQSGPELGLVCCDGGFDGAQIPQHSSNLSPTKTTYFDADAPLVPTFASPQWF